MGDLMDWWLAQFPVHATDECAVCGDMIDDGELATCDMRDHHDECWHGCRTCVREAQ